MNSSALGRNMRLSIAEGGLATAMGSLFSGVFLIGFALAMGASRLQIGILFALPSICGVTQLAGSYWLERYGNSRGLCLWALALSRLLFLPVLLVAVFSNTSELRVWWIVAIMALSGMLGSIGGVAWLTWIRALVPANFRVRFLGRRDLVNTALAFSVCLMGGAIVDRWGNVATQGLGGYLVVFAIAMVFGLASLLLMAQIPAGSAPPCPSERPPFGRMLLSPLRDGNYRRIVGFYSMWNLSVNIATPFYSVFFLEKLGLPVGFIVILNALNSICGMAANTLWTRLAHRFGIKPIVLIASVGDALYPLALVFVDPAWAWVLFVLHLSGIFNSPVAVGPDNFILKLAPEKNASSYMAVFRSIIGLATVLAALLGGGLAGSLSGTELTLGPVILDGLKAVFLLSFVGRMMSLLVLRSVHEPGASSIPQMLESLHRQWRPVRPTPQPAGELALLPLPQEERFSASPMAAARDAVATVPLPAESRLAVEPPTAA